MALLEYVETPWVNGTAPAINATNLLNIETGITDVTNEVINQVAYVLPPADNANLGGIKLRVETVDGVTTGYIYVV